MAPLLLQTVRGEKPITSLFPSLALSLALLKDTYCAPQVQSDTSIGSVAGNSHFKEHAKV